MILDASAAAVFLLPDEGDPAADLAERLAVGPVLAPQHWPLEITNLLLKAQRRGRIDEARRDWAIERVVSWAVRLDPQTEKLAYTDILAIATEHRLTIYDAAYLELALRSRDTLASNDADLVDAARTCGVEVLTNLP